MRIKKVIVISILISAMIYGCGEDAQSPLDVVSKTSRIPTPEGFVKGKLGISNSKDVKIAAGDKEITTYETGEFFVPEAEIPQMLVAMTKDDKVLFLGVNDPRKKQIEL
ncbi:MAG: hypothetical protein AAB116_20790 [Candidatus Poribacteria bacterium]